MSQRVDPRQADAAARRLARSEFQRPLMLVAGAGTGKTTTLVSRVLLWSLGPGWEEMSAKMGDSPDEDAVAARVLEGVVAITFTEAAAAQMANKLGEALFSVERGEGLLGVDDDELPPERQTRARALLGAMDRVVICTIHAFCRRLLAAHPLEAGLHPFFQLDPEGSELSAVVREVVETRLKDAYAEAGDSDFLSLAELGVGPQQLASALESLATESVPAEVFDEDPFADERLSVLWGAIAERATLIVEAMLPKISHMKSAKASLALCERLSMLATVTRQRDADITQVAAFLESQLESKHYNRLRDWSKSRYNKSESAELVSVAEDIAREAGALLPMLRHVPKLAPERTRLARAVLRPLLAEVNRQLHARGIVSFQALLVRARDLMVNRTDVARSVRRRIRQLLVDEFQDTDRVQCDLVGALAFDGPASERPGLFLVGDPKQSIYGWRGAELSAYFDFVDTLVAHKGLVCSLTVNFRSAPPILDEVGRVVQPIMRYERGVQAEYETLLPAPDKIGATGFFTESRAPVEHWVAWPGEPGGHGPAGKLRVSEATRLEAESLAADLVLLNRDHGVAWRDCALLMRSMTHLDRFLQAMRDANIPYAVERDRSYYKRREVIDASALVRCILDPNDHMALVTLLRSPLVGVPDAALMPLWRARLPELLTDLVRPDTAKLEAVRAAAASAVEAVSSEVPGLAGIQGWEDSLVAAACWLAELRDAFEHDPADTFVERLRSRFHLEATEAARYLGHYRLANLDRLFRTLLAALDEGGGDPQAILRALRTNISRSKDQEEGRPKETAGDAVQVMTVHKSKGMDFGHVYFMGLHARNNNRDDGDNIAERTATPGGPVWEYRVLGDPTPGWYRVAEARRAVEETERVRLVYVALTRAKIRLVVSGMWPTPKLAEDDSDLSERAANSMMDLIARREGGMPDLRAVMTELSESAAAAEHDACDTRWVFPALRPPVPRAESPKISGEHLLSLARDHAAWLSKARIEAESRKRRPLGSAASKESHAFMRAAVADRRFGEEGSPDEGVGSALGGSEHMDEDDRIELAVGSAIHRVLETMDLNGAREEELSGQRDRLRAYLRTLLGSAGMDKALRAATRLLDRLSDGDLVDQLRELAPHVLARELPVLLPAIVPAGPDDAISYISGAVDMVYRDPNNGEIVVVDYKADIVPKGSVELEERAAGYAHQGRVYRRAVEDALGCPARLELWFLWPDEIWVVPEDEPPRRAAAE